MTIPDIMFDSYSWTEINIFMFVKRNTAKDGSLQVSLRNIADEFGVTRSKVNFLLHKFYAQNLLANTQQTPSKHLANTQQTPSKHLANTTTTENQEVKPCQQTPSKHLANTQQTPSKHLANTQQTLGARKHRFGEVLISYISQYGKHMIREFFDYWTETNENGAKMRFEKEKTFDVKLRLARWKKNDTEKKNHAAPNSDIGVILKDSQEKDYTEGLW